MTEGVFRPDGREGISCPDCGAILQAAAVDGAQVLRCPWAKPETWKRYDFVVNIQIYCDKKDRPTRYATALRSD